LYKQVKEEDDDLTDLVAIGLLTEPERILLQPLPSKPQVFLVNGER
jgi:hypothetical protein